jgi:hypothetical protein
MTVPTIFETNIMSKLEAVEEASAIYAPIHHRRCAASCRPIQQRKIATELSANSASPLRC